MKVFITGQLTLSIIQVNAWVVNNFIGLFTFSGWPGRLGKIKIKIYYETISITKIAMVVKYLEDRTSVHSRLANSTLLSHTLSCLCFWQQQLLNFYEYLVTHTMKYWLLQLYFHHMTMITWFTFLFEILKKGLGWIHET